MPLLVSGSVNRLLLPSGVTIDVDVDVVAGLVVKDCYSAN